MRRIVLTAIAATSLVLAGCGGGDSGGLDDIKVSSAKAPKVTVDEGFTTDETTSKVLKQGGGDKLVDGDLIKVNYVAVNGRTGKQFDSSFTSGAPLTMTLDKTKVLPGFATGLIGKEVGSRVLVAVPPKDGFGQAQEQLDIQEDDTMVFLFDVVSKVPTEVTGDAKKLPSDVPQLKLDDDKHPVSFTKTGKTAKKVTKQSTEVVIKGKGDKLEAGQTLTAQYVGQVYPDGDVFDESWSSGARTFQVGAGSLIKCWDEQLVGQTLGSRVVLVCPGDKAYGDQPPAGGKIKKDDTLIFAIDLLDAS